MNAKTTEPTDERTPYDVFMFFLAPAHITKTTTLTIKKAIIKDVYNPHTGDDEPSLIVFFERAHRVLKLNKTQTESMFEIAGDDHTKWGDTKVILSPDVAKGGKKTIKIEKA